MRNILLLLCVLIWSATDACGQNLTQARKWYAEGEFAKALPVFGRYLRSTPSNGNYNLWYGVCCLETGQASLAIPPLETAVKKRVTSGQLYLAQAYHAAYRYGDAVRVYEEYIAELKRRHRSTQLADSLLEESRKGLRFIRGVERVCVIDSIVMDKDKFLSAYSLSEESGKLMYTPSDEKKQSSKGGTAYETELGDRRYYAAPRTDSLSGIWVQNKLSGEWGRPRLLPHGINDAGNAGYPYMMTDGVTFYFASESPASLGGYDIFVTRYNADDGSFLEPQNVGMPFNSPANDYLYVVDEFNGIGWFATDRNQPEGKVCVYTFIPNKMKQVYDYENTDHLLLAQLASLHSIQDTWTDKKTVDEALARLEESRAARPETVETGDFTFIIDDRRTYHKREDFRSDEAEALFGQYQETGTNLRKSQARLEKLRDEYQESDHEGRTKLTPAILDLEKHVEDLRADRNRLAKEVRKKEISASGVK